MRIGGVIVAGALALAGCGDEERTERLAAAKAAASKPFVVSVRADAATIWAVGDGADGRPGSIALGKLIAARKPARFLYLGDVYEDGTRAEFQANYHTVYGSMTKITAPTPGNHEWGLRAYGYRPYWRAQKDRSTVPGYYVFSVAGWRILSLNSQKDHGPGSVQLRWLARQVDGSGTCRIAFLHRPRWSAGEHGNAPDLAPVWNTLRGHARLVLSGHDHNSQRLRARGGITQLVAGAGGRHLYRVDRSRSDLVWANASSLAALRLRLSPGLARFAFVRADGAVLHSGEARCRRR